MKVINIVLKTTLIVCLNLPLQPEQASNKANPKIEQKVVYKDTQELEEEVIDLNGASTKNNPDKQLKLKHPIFPTSQLNMKHDLNLNPQNSNRGTSLFEKPTSIKEDPLMDYQLEAPSFEQIEGKKPVKIEIRKSNNFGHPKLSTKIFRNEKNTNLLNHKMELQIKPIYRPSKTSQNQRFSTNSINEKTGLPTHVLELNNHNEPLKVEPINNAIDHEDFDLNAPALPLNRNDMDKKVEEKKKIDKIFPIEDADFDAPSLLESQNRQNFYPERQKDPISFKDDVIFAEPGLPNNNKISSEVSENQKLNTNLPKENLDINFYDSLNSNNQFKHNPEKVPNSNPSQNNGFDIDMPYLTPINNDDSNSQVNKKQGTKNISQNEDLDIGIPDSIKFPEDLKESAKQPNLSPSETNLEFETPYLPRSNNNSGSRTEYQGKNGEIPSNENLDLDSPKLPDFSINSDNKDTKTAQRNPL